MSETKFEKDLEEFFPQIYRLHQIGKWDKKVWVIVESMEEMVNGNSFGEIRITYQGGKINHIYKTDNKA